MKQVLRAMTTDGGDDSFDLSNQSTVGSSSSKSEKPTKVNSYNLRCKACCVELSTLSLCRLKAMNSILSGRRGKAAF